MLHLLRKYVIRKVQMLHLLRKVQMLHLLRKVQMLHLLRKVQMLLPLKLCVKLVVHRGPKVTEPNFSHIDNCILWLDIYEFVCL